MSLINMDFEGLEETYKEIEKLSTETQLREINKRIVKKAGVIAEDVVKKQIRKKAYSDNPKKSGRKGSRTGQHAGDNVPKKGSTKNGQYVETIGWEKTDTSPYFYMKFQEWGTSKKPIQIAKKFMLDSSHNVYPKLKHIAEEEYEKILKEKLEG